MTVIDTEVAEVHDIRIADSSGDTQLTWDRNDPVSVAAAKAAFKVAKDKRHLIYKTDRFGNKAERITEFDPNAEHIICQPQTVGG